MCVGVHRRGAPLPQGTGSGEHRGPAGESQGPW